VSTRRISMTLMPLEMLASFSSLSSVLRDGGAAGRAVVGGALRLRIVSSAILGLLASRGESDGGGESVCL